MSELITKEKKKIVWISYIFVDLFLCKTQTEILKPLVKKGYDIHYFAIRSKKKVLSPDPRIHMVLIPLRYIPIISPLLYTIFVFFFQPIYILITRPQFVIAEPSSTILGSIWNPILNHIVKFKTILDIRSIPVEIKGFRGFLEKNFYDFSIHVSKKFFDGITTLTPLMKADICKEYNIDARFVGVWTSGVSIDHFLPEKYNGFEMRRKFGLTDKFIIFYHGVFMKSRGLFETIRSIEIIKRKYPKIVFFLLGNGTALQDMEELIKTKKIQDSVFIHDAVDYMSVPNFISMCDVGIVPLPDLPDWRHQCPLKLLEYLAMEKVVIVTDIPANREVIGSCKCGIFISSNKPDEIAKAIIKAYNNKARLKEWGSYGRDIIEKKYSWEKVAKDLENYLLIANKKNLS